MRNTHLRNGWSATGQNITVFEDGKIAISLDRNLNSTPAGIKGANTGALCVEIVGNFDKGGNVMTGAQKQAVTHLYACLAIKLNIPIDTSHIVYHAWYTPNGTWLGDYVKGKSSKTCPGTLFWGDGNTKAAANKGFIPAIKAEIERIKNGGNEVTRQEYETLNKRVSDIENTLERVPAPAWFVKEFGSADLGGKITDPYLTFEGWRTLAIGLRSSKN